MTPVAPMRIAVLLDWTADPRAQADLAPELERAGADLIWVPEAYGHDAPTLLGAIAARTERVLVGPGVLSVYSRTPALLAQTAAGLDALSGGRAVLGLGTSGAQVVEGFHGVPFTRPLDRLRETVALCRAVWRREPLAHRGRALQIPVPAGRGTGLGRPLRTATRPLRESVPIHIAALAPGSVALAAEVAEGWFPLLFAPEHAERAWGAPLADGRARRDPALPPLDVCAAVHCAVGPERDVAALRARARAELALYIGGMGSAERNHYADAAAAFGWAGAARTVQRLFLSGARDEAAAALPEDLVRALTACGPPAHVGERLAALRAAGVTTLCVRPLGDPVRTVAAVREIAG